MPMNKKSILSEILNNNGSTRVTAGALPYGFISQVI